ncbi:MAG: DUF362 domain-containing protein [Desulfomonilia bacterium]
MKRVALLRHRGYELPALKETILRGLDGIGFSLTSFRGARVVLKPNLLSASLPQSAVVTHPHFFRAAAEIVIDHGGKPVLAESPAVSSLGNALKTAEYAPVIKELGIPVADLSEIGKLSYPAGRRMKSFEITRAFFDADMIVNLPKFKTHGLTYITAAVKNLFGAVPGLRKSQMHLKFPEKDDFCSFILDLYGAFLNGFDPPKTMVHIMDAIIAMEGEGPGTTGRPRAMNAVIAGLDALAVDWVAVQVSGLDIRLCTTLTEGFQRGFGITSGEEVGVVGETIEEMRVHDFREPQKPGATRFLRVPLIHRAMKNLFTDRPVPVAGRCTLCYQCMQICPAHAIGRAEAGERTPRFDKSACIRCLCCLEVCPEEAISLNKGPLRWMMQ